MAEKAENKKGRAKGKLSMKDAAQVVLEEAGGPLKSNEILKQAQEKGLIKTEGKTPEATMAAQLSVAVKRGDERFVKTKPGVYGLKGRDRKGQNAVDTAQAAA